MKKRTIITIAAIAGFCLMFAVQYDWIHRHEAQYPAIRLVVVPILTALLTSLLAFIIFRYYHLIAIFEQSRFLGGFVNSSATGKKEFLYAALLLALIIVISFNNVFFFGRTFRSASMNQGVMSMGSYQDIPCSLERPLLDSGASAWQFEPWAAKVRRDFASGQIPLWNSNSGFGAPLLANMQSAPFSPFQIFIHFFSFSFGWELYIALRMLVGGFFTYLYLRLFRRSPIASFTAAVVFMFCGYNILNLNMAHLDVDILAPAGVFVFECLFRNHRPIRVAFCSIFVCLTIIGGMPESAFCVLLLALLYYGFRLVFFRPSDASLSSYYLPKLGYLSISMLLGFLLSGPQVMPFLEYYQNSWTTHTTKVGVECLSLMGAITLVVPHFFGDVLFATWNKISQFQLMTYIGAVPALLAFYSIFSKGNKDEKKLIAFYALICFLIIAKYFGFSFINWIGLLPGFSKLIFYKYVQPELAFCFAVLAGMGMDALIERRISLRSLLVSLIAMASLVPIYFLANGLDLFPELQNQSVYNHVRINIERYLLLLLIASLFAFLAIKKYVKLAVILLALLVFIELISYIPRDRAIRTDAAAVPPYVKFLRSDQERFRVFGVDSILYPNASNYFDLDCITNLDAMYLPGYFPFIQSFLSPKSGERFVAESMPRLDEIEPYLSLVNVKYVLTKAKSSDNSELAENDNSEGDGSKIPPDFTMVYNGEIRILQNKNFLPRAFIASEAVCANSEAESLQLLRTEIFNLRNKVVLEGAPEHCGKKLSEKKEFASEAKIASYSSHEIAIQTQSSGDGFLVLTDSYYPGWKAFVDGKEQTILRADRLFRALPLKAGRHQVQFIYTPASFKIGLISFVISFACLCAWLFIKRR